MTGTRMATICFASSSERISAGIELDRPCGDILGRAAQAGLMLSVTAERVIRLVPALILSEDEAKQIVAILVPVIKAFLAETDAAKK